MKRTKKIFNKVYDEYVDKIYRFIYFKVSSQEITQDLCSETFLRYWNRLNKQDNIDNTQAFLYKIASNLIVDHYAEKSRTQTVPINTTDVVDPKQDLGQEIMDRSDTDIIKNVGVYIVLTSGQQWSFAHGGEFK